jgi:hypothetical protein
MFLILTAIIGFLEGVQNTITNANHFPNNFQIFYLITSSIIMYLNVSQKLSEIANVFERIYFFVTLSTLNVFVFIGLFFLGKVIYNLIKN